MFRSRLLKLNLAIAAVIALAAIGLLLSRAPLDNPLERAWYQAMIPTHTSAAAQNIVRIDLDGVRPREQLIHLLPQISRQHPAAVGVYLDLSAPAPEAPDLAQWAQVESLSAKVVARKLPRTAARLQRLAGQGKWLGDTDARLARAIRKTRGIYLAMHSAPATQTDAQTAPAHVFKPRLRHATIAKPAEQQSADIPMRAIVRAPLKAFVEEASGVGDGSIADSNTRNILKVRLITPTQDRWAPSLPLLLAVKQALGHTQNIRITETGVRFGDIRLPLDRQGRLMPGFTSAPGERPFPLFKASDVLDKKLGWRQLQNKIVLIGTPETPRWPSPVGMLTDRELQAHAIASVLDAHYFVPHRSAGVIQAAIVLGIAFMLALVIAQLPVWVSSSIAMLTAAGLTGVDAWLLFSRHVWLPAATALATLGLLFAILLAIRLLHDARLRIQRDAAEMGRDLGLLYQQRGNLDKALNVFRQLPPDRESLELMYGLGKEFERKRRFHQAIEAYDWIIAQDASFRDALRRREKAAQLETMSMTSTGSVAAPLLMIEGMDHKPTLGRYEVEKLIGRGAMGEVYLGRDPSIDRVVAIKTLPLASEFAPEELEEVRSRFFHEAAAAGRLNHSNIVTIYDVGEEHDLAFMAMEYIDGYSLNEHARPDQLLPMERVIEYIAQTADALDYAHQEGIVHRDVKPANLMIDKKKDRVKITDFGIARITSNSRTKTGMLLGTPSYMSPEQSMGSPVDSRSDIFSLGTTLFVLLSGTKPFSGDSVAALSYQIIHEPHPDIRKINPEVPDTLKRIIDKALQKSPDKRYQSASAMAKALRKLLDG